MAQASGRCRRTEPPTPPCQMPGSSVTRSSRQSTPQCALPSPPRCRNSRAPTSPRKAAPRSRCSVCRRPPYAGRGERSGDLRHVVGWARRAGIAGVGDYQRRHRDKPRLAVEQGFAGTAAAGDRRGHDDSPDLAAEPGAATDRTFADDQRGRVARTSCSGLIGVVFTSTPNGAKASQTALAMAAGGATAPPSPTPFTPSGLSGDGECW